ncbi:MAG: DUF4421 domain-containing protein [Bacteroidales bacterium]|nr:DUF4421 domain-containing protein [Bacteroidales bacterium]
MIKLVNLGMCKENALYPIGLIFILSFLCRIGVGQTHDSSYYSSYKDKLQVYVHGVSKFSSFKLKEDNNSNKSFDFQPNENLNLGFGFNYKWLGLGVAFKTRQSNNLVEKYGNSSGKNIYLDVFTKKWYLNLKASNYQGYYLNNPDVIYAGWNNNDSVIIRPDINTFNLALNSVFALNNNKFSLKSAFVCNEQQKKNAGSWLLGWYSSLYALDADSSLIPSEFSNQYQQAGYLMDLVSIKLGTALGYTYTFVFNKHLYTNIALMTGLSAQAIVVSYDNSLEVDKKTTFSLKWHGRLAFGYQNEKNFTGFTFVFDRFNLNTPSNAKFNYIYGKFRVYYGRRFSVGGK